MSNDQIRLYLYFFFKVWPCQCSFNSIHRHFCALGKELSALEGFFLYYYFYSLGLILRDLNLSLIEVVISYQCPSQFGVRGPCGRCVRRPGHRQRQAAEQQDPKGWCSSVFRTCFHFLKSGQKTSR